MYKVAFFLKYSLLAWVLWSSPFSLLAQQASKDQCLSPYFFVNSDDPSVDALPLLSSTAIANIAGVIADVEVTQVYKNDGKNTLEAIYVFPASTRAAVYDMEMTIGNRTIHAEVKEKGKARTDYEKAKSEGKRASLLEQSRPNVFQMNVANITPGDEIKIVLRYTELLVPEGGVYEWVYPTVVGPRYSETSAATASADDQYLATPYLREGTEAPYTTNIEVYLSAGMPIQCVDSKSHQVLVDNETLSTASILLDPSEKNAGNRDYVLQYRLAGGKINSGLLLYEHEDENFFLMMVQPPERSTIDQIPPREYVFVVDVSGSMNGFPLTVSKKLMRDLIVGLRPSDRFNVLLFAGGYAWMSAQSVEANSDNVEKAANFIDQQQGSGGTRLVNALKEVLSLPRPTNRFSRSIVVVTDGYIDVEQETFDLIRQNLNQANLFAFGIGTSVNRHLIEGMAHMGNSEPLVVLNQGEAHQKAEKFRNYINSPVLTQIQSQFKGMEVYDVEPLSIPDVLAERPVLVYGKYKGSASGEIVLKGKTGSKDYEQKVSVSKVRPSVKNSAIRYLWAREQIRTLDDYNHLRRDPQRVAKVTELGLKYNLLTAYTSFVAIDEQIVKQEETENTTVHQPLPMPQGAPDAAVGFDLGIEGVVKNKTSQTLRLIKITPAIASDLEDQLKAKLPDLQRFFKDKNIRGEVQLQITLDPSFGIVAVKVLKGKMSVADKDALLELLGKWTFIGLQKERGTMDFVLRLGV